eukprot:2699643-Lingulodinium_polyedra.AAC.1
MEKLDGATAESRSRQESFKAFQKDLNDLDEMTELRRRGAEWYAEEEEEQWEEPVGSAPVPAPFHIGTDVEDGAAGGDGDDEGFTLVGRRKKRATT